MCLEHIFFSVTHVKTFFVSDAQIGGNEREELPPLHGAVVITGPPWCLQ